MIYQNHKEGVFLLEYTLFENHMVRAVIIVSIEAGGGGTYCQTTAPYS